MATETNLDKDLAAAVEQDLATPGPLMPTTEDARRPVPLRTSREPDVANIMAGIANLYERLTRERRNAERQWQDSRLVMQRDYEDRLAKLDEEHFQRDADYASKLQRIIQATQAIR